MLKTGIYVDAENIRLCGGYGMRYDVLADLANTDNSVLLRANSYVVEDRTRTKEDAEYRQKLYHYHDILRQYGFKLIKKYV
ncbi:MAG: NYN domain-containing protein, partial [Desulfobulbaceae bacterium]|nr:NYN domain-containing protein [Desulfobulbaceae bacterium]